MYVDWSLSLKGLVSYGDIETSIFTKYQWNGTDFFYKVLHKLFHLEIPDFLGREEWKNLLRKN